MIVMKFGGSSVESAAAIQRVAEIVRVHEERVPVVVVSAMGKTTDRLLAIARLSAAGRIEGAARELGALLRFHLTESSQLARGAEAVRLDHAVRALFDELRGTLENCAEARELNPRLTDEVSSFGERLSSLIVTAALRRAGLDAVHLDARDVIVTDARYTQAAPLFDETNALLRRRVAADRITVMGGFIGATEDGVTTTLGRGGSDYTAAIVGAALSADEIQIWTDVDGMLTCDPRVVSAAHCLRSISFSEAEQMARAGAKVLHPATVAPAVRQRIPISIRNSRNPAAAGTTISGESPCDGAVMSIACRQGLTILRLRPRTTPVTADFSRDVWEFFEKAEIPLEPISMSRAEIGLGVDAGRVTPEMLRGLEGLAEVGVEENCALVTLVGRNAARNPANVARALLALRKAQIKTPGGAAMTVGSDSRFAFVMPAAMLDAAAEALHEEFFGQPDPAYFVVSRASVAMSGVAGREGVAATARLSVS